MAYQNSVRRFRAYGDKKKNTIKRPTEHEPPRQMQLGTTVRIIAYRLDIKLVLKKTIITYTVTWLLSASRCVSGCRMGPFWIIWHENN